MNRLEQHIAATRNHDIEHLLGDTVNPHLAYDDWSCLVCYPLPELTPLPQEFHNFWAWYSLTFPATAYSSVTVDTFHGLPYINNLPDFENSLRVIILSIRYQSISVPPKKLKIPSTLLSSDLTVLDNR
jgi:hypothetical protein